MHTKTLLEPLHDVLKSQLHQQINSPTARSGHSGQDSAPFTIAISREAGANGHLVARAIGEKLGWPVYDRELLEVLGRDLGVRSAFLEGLDEKQVGWFQECMEGLSTGQTVSQTSYVTHLVETLMTLAAHGRCIIVGRGAAQVLPRASTLRVRLVAPLDHRVAVMQKRLGIWYQQAVHAVEKIDRERSKFVSDHFHKDANDCRNYDLTLNTAHFAVEDCARLVIDALQCLQAAAAARNVAEAAPTP